MVGKKPVRSVASKSLGSTTVMWMVLVLVTVAWGGSEVTGRSGVGYLGRFDLMFFQASLAWPFAVASIFGRCFAIISNVRPGHVEKFPLLISIINVVGTEGKAAW